jgi:hypothetical protein
MNMDSCFRRNDGKGAGMTEREQESRKRDRNHGKKDRNHGKEPGMTGKRQESLKKNNRL